MFRRYGHQHSLVVGALVGLLLAQHVFVVAVAALALGVVLGRSWGFWSQAAGALRDKILHARRERIRTAPEPVYSARSKRVEDIPF